MSTISELDLALVGTLKDVNNVLSDQRGFVFALKVFQKKLLWSLESLNTQTQSYFLELAQKMENVSKSVLTRINVAVQDTIEDTEWHLTGLQSVSFEFLKEPKFCIFGIIEVNKYFYTQSFRKRISKSLRQMLLT